MPPSGSASHRRYSGAGRMDRAVRVGVLGLRRGAALARLAQQAGMELVAVCERDDRRREAATALGAAAYRDVEPFLNHAMDAVILVNDFDQHAPVAVRALDRGLSVRRRPPPAAPSARASPWSRRPNGPAAS